MKETLPRHIYNPFTAMRFSAMVIFQLDNINTLVGNSNDPPLKNVESLNNKKGLKTNQGLSKLVKTGRKWSKLVESDQNWSKLFKTGHIK